MERQAGASAPVLLVSLTFFSFFLLAPISVSLYQSPSTHTSVSGFFEGRSHVAYSVSALSVGTGLQE